MATTFLHPIIEFLVKHGIPVNLCLHKDGQIVFNVEGFYKSGNVSLVPKGENFTAIDRSKNEHEIEDVHDLAMLNLRWWDISKERCDVWNFPDIHWIPLLMELGMIEEESVKTYKKAKLF